MTVLLAAVEHRPLLPWSKSMTPRSMNRSPLLEWVCLSISKNSLGVGAWRSGDPSPFAFYPSLFCFPFPPNPLKLVIFSFRAFPGYKSHAAILPFATSVSMSATIDCCRYYCRGCQVSPPDIPFGGSVDNTFSFFPYSFSMAFTLGIRFLQQ